MMLVYNYPRPFLAVFDNASDVDDAAAAAKAAADKAAADKAAADLLANPDGKKTFTQDELNTILARERRTYEDKTKQTISQLEELKKSKGLSDTEKQKLSERIEALNNELLTKEQLAAKEREKLKKTHDEEKGKLTQERDTWQKRYQNAEINRAIYDSATQNDAFDPSQIAALLVPNTSLVADVDNEGNETGSFTPKVKFQDTDKEGKQVTLDLTIPEAVKRMKDIPEKFGNLFKSTAAGGLGMGGNQTQRGQQDLSKMSPSEWRKFRKTSGLANAGK